MLRTLLLATALAVPAMTASAQIRDEGGAAPPRLGEAPVQDVLDAMTIREKALLLVGVGFDAPIPGLPPMSEADRALPDRVPGAAGRTHPIPRVGVPMLVLADGPAGVRVDPSREGDDRTYYATAFPVATLLASSWDPALMEEVGAAFGREARDFGVDVLLAPGMNLHRNPLGGRNFEYYSEDPLLSGRMAAAFVRGVEGEGVGTAVKHLAVNNQEWNRMQLDARVGERALRELYLRGFEIAVREGRPRTVMSAYNRINGQYASESRDLLTTILRDEWGFEGAVMTDWFAGSDPVAQVAAGNDLIMPGDPSKTAAIVAAVLDGSLPMADLDASVARVLGVVLQSPTFRGADVPGRPDLAASRAVARRAAAEGMVLLQNEGGALPLPAGVSLALFGNGGYRLVKGGTGSGDVHVGGVVALGSGLAAAGYAVDAALASDYEAYLAEQEAERPAASPFFLPPPIPERPVGAAEVARLAGSAEAAVVVLSRNSGEFADREVAGDFDLTDAEQALLRDVSEAFHAEGKPVIAVLNVGGVIETASWRDRVDAVLLAWQPGQEGGHAMADVLSGAVNPSGKLPMTWPVAYADVPSAGTWPGEEVEGAEGAGGIFGTPAQTAYEDGLYVGYRYYDTAGVAPAFPFGHGLSYSAFHVQGLDLRAAGDGAYVASTTVTNVGAVPGREVVQLYVNAPSGGLARPLQELRAFAKTRVLAPGESERVELALDARALAAYDPAREAWVVEGGRYVLAAGTSSRSLQASLDLDLPADRVVERAHAVLRPTAPIPERPPARR